MLVTSVQGDDDPLLYDTANMPGKGEHYGAVQKSVPINPPKEDWQEQAKSSQSGSKYQFLKGKKARYGMYSSTTTRQCGVLSVFVIVPWLIFTVIVAALLFAYHKYSMSVWFVVLMHLAIAVLFAALGISNRRTGFKSIVLGALCAFATFSGTLVGLWGFHRIAAQYWMIEESRTYTNVLPAEPAVGHADAGTLFFEMETHVDLGKVVGYKTEGTVYCVAPILKQAGTVMSRVEYWAAGTDCCHARTGFSCGDAWDRSARAGVVLPDAVKSTSALFPGSREQYLKAAAEAAGVYGVLLGDEPLFMTWTNDVPEAREEMLHNIWIFLLAASGIFFCFSCLCAAVIYFVGRLSSKQQEASTEELVD